MKTINFRRATWLSAIIIAASLLLVSCYKDDDYDTTDSNSYALSGNASGAQEVPSNSSTATGTMTGSYNKATNVLQYNISWSGLTGPVTGMHFHGPASVGVSAGILVEITTTSTGISGSTSGSVTVEESFETALLAGQVYYNIHTALYPAGEIRGQITASGSGGTGGGGSGGGGGGY
jgi:hypothetical protein